MVGAKSAKGKQTNGKHDTVDTSTWSGPSPLYTGLVIGVLVVALFASTLVEESSKHETEYIVDAGLDEREEFSETLPPNGDAKQPARKSNKKKKASSLEKNPFALDIPRVSLLELTRNATLLTGHHAFVLTGLVSERWKAQNWTLNLLKNKIPFEWVDYYPDNMKNMGNKPYLLKLEEAVPKFKERTGVPKYMQMRISLKGWKRLRKDLQPMPEPATFWSDDTWIRHCMQKEDGKPDEDAISNFYTTNQWKFLLIGEKGTSMFFHKDHTAASSWQAMIQGRKKWTLCPNTESPYLALGIDTFNPDYESYPQFARAHCGQVVVETGEMVYYPAYWWHHTYQLDTPSIAYTGALVGTEAEYDSVRHLGGNTRKAHEKFYEDLMHKCSACWTKGQNLRKCDDISLKWPGAAPPPLRRVCEKFLPKCYKLWDEHARDMQSKQTSDLDTQNLGSFE